MCATAHSRICCTTPTLARYWGRLSDAVQAACSASAAPGPARTDLRRCRLGIDAADLRHAGRGNADIEGRSERNVEPAVLVRRQIFPAMRRIGRHVVIDHLTGAEIVVIGFGVCIDQLVGRDDVKRPVPECETGGHVQALEDGLDLFLPAIVLDRIDIAEAEGAYEQGALIAPGHLARGQHVRGVDFDLIRRQFDLLHHRGEFGFRCAGRRTRWRREALFASVSSPRNQSSGGWVQNSLVPESYFFNGFCCALA